MARIGIIGGGPAGLMAAEAAAGVGVEVIVYEAMPTVGRKLLMAGKSGLNITHSEDRSALLDRYGSARARLEPAIAEFDGAALRQWCSDLGIPTFVGSSGRVFPEVMKASPLLRAWGARLERLGVRILTRHRWIGFDQDGLVFETPDGQLREWFDAVVLALGGASWPRLGSDGRWVPDLAAKGVDIAPFRPANCGFERDWSPIFSERFAGEPLKSIVAASKAGSVPGEFVISRWGVEGSLIYAHAAALRDQIEAEGSAVLTLDLMPGRTAERLARDLARQPAKTSFSNRLRKGAGLDPVKASLLREVTPEAAALSPEALASRIKSLPLGLERTRSLAEAISVAGGVTFDAIDEDGMLTALPGVFVAGEMVDWEAPTGGYLLTACFATGRAAGLAAARYARRS